MLSIKAVITRKNIPKMTLLINRRSDVELLKSVKFGVINAKANHPADILIDNPESALSHGLVEILITMIEL